MDESLSKLEMLAALFAILIILLSLKILIFGF